MHAGARMARRIVLGLLLTAIIGAVIFVTTTPSGRLLLHDPHQHAQAVKQWVAAHPLIAPALVITLYILFGILALPVWWMQILAGYGFGLFVGIVWCDLGATISAVSVAAISRWLSTGAKDQQASASSIRLRALSEKLGHNGLLVVITIRVAHFLPFSLSNYALGLTKISFRNIAIGTLLGSIPAIMTYVGLGVGKRMLEDWWFVTTIVAINLLLLVPLALRYLKPEWFKRFGIE
jgi:uncharacterized membrane protein YdjX (TVP38/TMEM64 family)